MNEVYSIVIYEYSGGYNLSFYDQQGNMLAREHRNVLAIPGCWDGDDVSRLTLADGFEMILHVCEEDQRGILAEEAWRIRGISLEYSRDWEREREAYQTYKASPDSHYGLRSFHKPDKQLVQDLLKSYRQDPEISSDDWLYALHSKKPPWREDKDFVKKVFQRLEEDADRCKRESETQ